VGEAAAEYVELVAQAGDWQAEFGRAFGQVVLECVMPIPGVLFDVGGPLDTEVMYERLVDEHIQEALAAEGISVTQEQYAAAERWAIDSFAGNTYQAIVWHLARRDIDIARRTYHAVNARADERLIARGGLELREGIADLLADLVRQGLLLGLAANQPAATIVQLQQFGLGQYFRHRELSGTHGFRKPDVRLFLRALADLDIHPQECVMIGDRIDNDIMPAKLLRLRTIRFRVGRHRHQEPRTWEEIPDVEVTDITQLRAAISALVDAAADAQIEPEEEME
jgi:HAD superfamily hydrolase (TIGR01549 family)